MSSTPTRRSAIAILAVLSMALTACARTDGAAPAETTKVVLIRGLPAVSATDAYLYAGIEQGFFKEEGINLEIQHLQAGGSAVPKLLATGDADIAMASGQPLAGAADSGLAGKSGLVSICQNYVASIFEQFAVAADSGIDSYADLRGRTVGVFDLGAAGAAPARGILLDAGVKPKDVEFVAVGAGPAAGEALVSGKVDALALWDTQYALLESLGTKFDLLPKARIPDVASIIMTRRDFLKAERDLLEGFLRATAKSVVFALSNPERAVELYHKAEPEAVAGANAEKAFARDLREFKTRLPKLDFTSADPPKFCASDVADWEGMAQWLGIKTVDDWKPYFTNELVDAANDFDIESPTNSG